MTRPCLQAVMCPAAVCAAAVCAVAMFAAAGCGDDSPQCRTEQDCPPDQICSGGRCRPRVQNDAAVQDGSLSDGSLSDAIADSDARTGCRYVDDSVIERSEMVFQVGLSAIYRVNTRAPVTVDLVGRTAGNETQWDYTTDTPSDQSVVDELLPVNGTWFAANFSDATYAAVLDASLDTLAVLRVTDTALSMLGVVSSEPNKTLLTYNPPVDLMRFPINANDSYVVNTDCAGTFNWMLFNAEETYDITVDAVGTVTVPAGPFHVLRMRTNFTQHVPLTTIWTTRIIYTYVTECFGVVARITSQDNERNDLFTEAAEYRRMTL